jgi:hypothetical protein
MPKGFVAIPRPKGRQSVVAVSVGGAVVLIRGATGPLERKLNDAPWCYPTPDGATPLHAPTLPIHIDETCQ